MIPTSRGRRIGSHCRSPTCRRKPAALVPAPPQRRACSAPLRSLQRQIARRATSRLPQQQRPLRRKGRDDVAVRVVRDAYCALVVRLRRRRMAGAWQAHGEGGCMAGRAAGRMVGAWWAHGDAHGKGGCMAGARRARGGAGGGAHGVGTHFNKATTSIELALCSPSTPPNQASAPSPASLCPLAPLNPARPGTPPNYPSPPLPPPPPAGCAPAWPPPWC